MIITGRKILSSCHIRTKPWFVQTQTTAILKKITLNKLMSCAYLLIKIKALFFENFLGLPGMPCQV
jgi:hypothetical protein